MDEQKSEIARLEKKQRHVPAHPREETAAPDAAPLPLTARREQAEVVKTIGARMREARELSNLSLSEAARRLGYKNPSKLSKVEWASCTNSVPLRLIRRAARLYDVSIDYLFGLMDDWETGAQKTQERAIAHWLHDALAAMRERDMQAVNYLAHQLHKISGPAGRMASDVEEVKAALDRFIELNPTFADEMRGGSRLARSVDRAVEDLSEMKAVMRLFHLNRDGIAGKIDIPQMRLF